MTPEEHAAYIEHRLSKARHMLDEAQVQVDNKLWDLAMNRCYFAAFHAVSALLAAKGEYPKTHKGLRQRFGLLYITTGVVPTAFSEVLTELFDARQSGDYEDSTAIDRAMVLRLAPQARDLVALIEKTIHEQH